MRVETAPLSGGAAGLPYLALAASSLILCLRLPDGDSLTSFVYPGGDRGALTAVACATVSVCVALNKLRLAPLSTFALTAASVALSTLAIGSWLAERSFPAFVAASSVVSAAQAFLSLPMRIQK